MVSPLVYEPRLRPVVRNYPPLKLPGACARGARASERVREMRRLLVASLLPSSVIAASFSPPRSNAPQPRSLPRRLGNFFSSMLEDSRIDYSTLKGRPRSLGFEAGGWAMKGEVPVKSEDGYEVATFAGGCFCELAPLTQRPRGSTAGSQHRLLRTAARSSWAPSQHSGASARARRRGHRAALPAPPGRRRHLCRVHAGQAERAHIQGGVLWEDGPHRGGPRPLQALRGELYRPVREADEHHRPDAAQPGGPSPGPSPSPGPGPGPSPSPTPSPYAGGLTWLLRRVESEGSALDARVARQVAKVRVRVRVAVGVSYPYP